MDTLRALREGTVELLNAAVPGHRITTHLRHHSDGLEIGVFTTCGKWLAVVNLNWHGYLVADPAGPAEPVFIPYEHPDALNLLAAAVRGSLK